MGFDPKNEDDIRRLRSAQLESFTNLAFQRKQRKEVAKRVTGEHYSKHGTRIPSPDNLAGLYVEIVSNHLVPKNPATLITSPVRDFSNSAELLELAVNATTEFMDLEETLRLSVVDALMMQGTVLVGRNIESESEETLGEPFAVPVSFDDFVYDTTGIRRSEVNFTGHRYWLLEDEFYDSPVYPKKVKDQIHSVSSRRDADIMDANDRASSIAQGDQEFVEFEKYIGFWDLWMPHYKVVVTIPVSGPAIAVRVIEWDGPESGPYHQLGFLEMPDMVMPVAPLLGGIDLHDIANAILWKVGRQAERARQVLTFSGPAQEDAELLRTAPDGMTLKVDHPERVKLQTLGGPDSNVLGFQIHSSRLFKRRMGNLDLLAGTEAGSPTATQDQLLSTKANRRIDDMAHRVRKFATGIVRSLAWYLFQDPLSVRQLNRPIEGFGDVRVRFRPEDHKGRITDYSISIDPYSSQPLSPNARAAKFLQYYQQMIRPDLPMRAAQGMSIDFQKLDHTAARYLDMPELKELVIYTNPQPQVGQGQGERPLQSPVTTRTEINAGGRGVDEEAQAMHQLLGSAVAGAA